MRIKINTNHDNVDKLIAVSCELTAFRKLTFRYLFPPKKLQAKKLLQSGFTLIELLVTLSLFVILTTVVIFNQSNFNGSILLTNLAYDVALTIRQAQSYGVNVRETVAGSGEFQKAYGVHFDITSEKKKFLLYSDDNKNDKYNASDNVVNSYNIKRGSYISKICVLFPNETEPECGIKKLDIMFLRPNPDAIIKCEGEGCDSNGSKAEITISSVDDKTRIVTINDTGQISIDR